MTTIDVLDVAAAATTERHRLAQRAVLASRRTWRHIDPAAIRSSWLSGPRRTLIGMVTDAQLRAAIDAEQAVIAMLLAQELDPAAAAALVPSGFAGVASDGRALGTLFDQAIIGSFMQIQRGRAAASALQMAGRWLDQAVSSQIVDASRAATQVATTTRRSVGGFYRVTGLVCCSRCAILSGRWYRHSASFQRHPRCHCGQVPAHRGALDDSPRLRDPHDYFHSLNRAEQDRIFTVAGAQAIRDGADVAKVVNARRNMTGRSLVDGIYRQAATRDDAIRLLAGAGFVL